MKNVTQKLINRHCIPAFFILILQVVFGTSSLTAKTLSAVQLPQDYYSGTSIDTDFPVASPGNLVLVVTGNEGTLGTEELLIISFKQMLAHIGQTFTLYVKDLSSGEVLDSVIIESVVEEDFEVESSVIEIGGSYQIDFWADLNENGQYDPPPADHAWRLLLEEVEGDTTIEFVHNGSFTDIMDGGATGNHSGVASADLVVYPNPAGPYVLIDSEKEMVEVRIYSMEGKLLRSMEDPGIRHLLVPTGTLPSGAYNLQVRMADRTDRFIRIVRQR